jgi:hypothetical protein
LRADAAAGACGTGGTRGGTGAAAGAVRRPEPQRTIGLVRRSLSVDDGWFGELAAILSQAGDAEVAQGARISQSPAVTTSKVV